MSKNNQNTLVPKFRFPEFKNSGEWVKKSLDEIGSVVASGDLNENTFSQIKTDTHIYPVYSNSVSQDGIYGYSSSFKYKSESVTITARGTLGVAFERKTDFVGIGRLLVVSDLKDTNANFLKENWNHQAKIPLENGGIPQLTAVKAKSISLFFPKLTEQQKIAACLSSLDELITAERQKLEVLKEHKKGLLQNLFPQEGETVPKVRFKESGEWVVKTLGDICKVTSGGTPSRTNNNYWNGDIPWISTTLIDFNTINSASEYITEAGLQNSSAKIFPNNTILMAMYGQGKTRGKVAILGIEAATNQACAAILLKQGYNTNYVFQNLAGRYDEIRKLSNQGGQENLSGGLIENISIAIPKNSKEQEKIASTLSSIDELIIAQNQKIESLKLHKKGLLQGLFPTVVETGHALSLQQQQQ